MKIPSKNENAGNSSIYLLIWIYFPNGIPDGNDGFI